MLHLLLQQYSNNAEILSIFFSSFYNFAFGGHSVLFDLDGDE